jgi:transposase
VADHRRCGVRGVDAGVAAMIRVDVIWLGAEPFDMRARTESALSRVVKVFGAAHPHHAYLFADRRANRMKVLVHDGVGIWLAARRLNVGKFVWPNDRTDTFKLTSSMGMIPTRTYATSWNGCQRACQPH